MLAKKATLLLLQMLLVGCNTYTFKTIGVYDPEIQAFVDKENDVIVGINDPKLGVDYALISIDEYIDFTTNKVCVDRKDAKKLKKARKK